MYVNTLRLERFRTFRSTEIQLVHPDHAFKALKLPKPQLPNVNLLLGNNGAGKTAFLKALALACLGPAVRSSGIYAYQLVRREPQLERRAEIYRDARIHAKFLAHPQDQTEGPFESTVAVVKRGDLEEFEWVHLDEKRWHPVFSERSDAFFVVGYGASRQIEAPRQFDAASRKRTSFARARRVQSLFEETYSLIPLNAWLPELETRNQGRYSQVLALINALMGQGHFTFSGEMRDGEYLFERGGLKVPFPALSDGYRAFLGWVGDLLYHVTETCPRGKKLVDNAGIVMVDEIDLHLHPKWQLEVLPTIARALPRIQFIVTSHSPLIVGSLEWMNIVLLRAAEQESTELSRVEWAVHGLDADQVLLSDFFGLESSRALPKQRKLKALTMRAREGDPDAARSLLEEMSTGLEAFRGGRAARRPARQRTTARTRARPKTASADDARAARKTASAKRVRQR